QRDSPHKGGMADTGDVPAQVEEAWLPLPRAVIFPTRTTPDSTCTQVRLGPFGWTQMQKPLEIRGSLAWPYFTKPILYPLSSGGKHFIHRHLRRYSSPFLPRWTPVGTPDPHKNSGPPCASGRPRTQHSVGESFLSKSNSTPARPANK